MSDTNYFQQLNKVMDRLDSQDARILMECLQKEIIKFEIDPSLRGLFETFFTLPAPSIIQKREFMESFQSDFSEEEWNNVITSTIVNYFFRRPQVNRIFYKQVQISLDLTDLENFEKEEAKRVIMELDLSQLLELIDDTDDTTWRSQLQQDPYNLEIPIWEKFDPDISYIKFSYPNYLDLEYLIPKPLASVINFFEPILPIYFSPNNVSKVPIADLGFLQPFFPQVCDALGTPWSRYGALGAYFSEDYRQQYIDAHKAEFQWVSKFANWLSDDFLQDSDLKEEAYYLFLAYQNEFGV